ncbi:conserved hypothetical protein [Bosea sp. 62]|nr:conserved hypothetical protein [Bosea sp. 7B]CAD5274643.1 conserved hypothetical protein [Bosea sp. 21B]CAD5275841.1 conserved hypothetical protein [Bosea sp. 46]VVT60077.1 conserved hypothetical protein [Bosea sp. EC-HK365B]VXB54227.1 conserved hypothetical protein [Bosea sp. 62]VXC15901.1 conserved hypothetical protein [Bosea sp. 29B]VXC16553.1 conserved hypothetical protein [Bosea sp. 127]VXC70123.1 conserved hypothetical protein [Bosea sp. 125]
MPRAAAKPPQALDPAIARLVEALAREAARRDHAAATGIRMDYDTRGPLRPVLDRSAK